MDDEQLNRLVMLKLGCPQAYYALCRTSWRETKSDVLTCQFMGVEPCETAYDALAREALKFPIDRPEKFKWEETRAELRAMIGDCDGSKTKAV